MRALDFAMRHPITVMVAMVAIALGSVFAVTRMRTDVFPDLNMPIIYVAQAYGGMDSAQMEGLITNYYEYAFLYMNGIDHIETKNIHSSDSRLPQKALKLRHLTFKRRLHIFVYT